MSHNIDGICCHIPSSSDCDKIVDCGFKWARIDINWFEVESKKGNYSWSSIDSAINNCLSHKLNIYASIAYTPSWASSRIVDPPNASDYYKICWEVASRYGKKIAVYSIWNEPNLETYFSGDSKDYVEHCLKPGYRAIKTINSDYLVAAPDLAINVNNWPNWMNGLKKYSKYFDIFSFHDYTDTPAEFIRLYNHGSNGKIAQIFFRKYRPYKSYISKFHKPTWVTEIGWDTKSFDQKEQKTRILDLSDRRDDIDVERIFLYVLKDAPSYAEEPYGIYTYEGKPKEVVKYLS